MEIEQVVDELYPRTFYAYQNVSLSPYSKHFLDEFNNLNLKRWPCKYRSYENVIDFKLDKLIDIFISLVKNNTMLFRDEWREIIKDEIAIRLGTTKMYEIIPSKINL